MFIIVVKIIVKKLKILQQLSNNVIRMHRSTRSKFTLQNPISLCSFHSSSFQIESILWQRFETDMMITKPVLFLWRLLDIKVYSRDVVISRLKRTRVTLHVTFSTTRSLAFQSFKSLSEFLIWLLMPLLNPVKPEFCFSELVKWTGCRTSLCSC